MQWNIFSFFFYCFYMPRWCIYVKICRCRDWNHMLNVRGGERGRVKVWTWGRRRGSRRRPVCMCSHSWGTGGSGRWRCLCAHVFVWVLQRAAAGHIFPVMGPHSPPDPIRGTFILTSGLWTQPTPSLVHILLCAGVRNRQKESFRRYYRHDTRLSLSLCSFCSYRKFLLSFGRCELCWRRVMNQYEVFTVLQLEVKTQIGWAASLQSAALQNLPLLTSQLKFKPSIHPSYIV